ncbi:MAG: sulfatase-like hydrolase/transferase, partial [Planctomycetota bacterium]|nr:sulfatase-like hydrolase/transferase [Planctomycetota bacterium]
MVFGSPSAASGQHPASENRPNIILVMADDQGWGDVGYNGHPFVKTPHLDEMSREGFVFDRFYAAAPVCSPTRASVMTGRTPIRTKVTNHGRYLRPQEETIGEALRDAGYSTGIFGKVHLGSGQPDSPCNPSGMGFDEWV